MHLYVNISGRKNKSMAEEELPAQHNSVPGAKSESTAASSTLWINYVTLLHISINNALEHLQTQNQVKTNSSLTRATPTCMSWLQRKHAT